MRRICNAKLLKMPEKSLTKEINLGKSSSFCSPVACLRRIARFPKSDCDPRTEIHPIRWRQKLCPVASVNEMRTQKCLQQHFFFVSFQLIFCCLHPIFCTLLFFFFFLTTLPTVTRRTIFWGFGEVFAPSAYLKLWPQP